MKGSIMKSEIIKNTEKISYPCLMISKDNTMVVLMTSIGEGVVLSNTDSEGYEIGHRSVTWVPNHFTPLKGKLVLEN